MKRHKNYLKALSAVVMGVTIVGAGFISSSGVYAEGAGSSPEQQNDSGDSLRIIVDQGDSSYCSIFGDTSVEHCDESYGTYGLSLEDNLYVLNLNPAINGKGIYITINDQSSQDDPNLTSTPSFVIRASGDIKTDISMTGEMTATFDLGEYSWDTNLFGVLSTKNSAALAFKSGIFNAEAISAPIVAISGAKVNLTDKDHNLASGIDSSVFWMNGGSLKITDNAIVVGQRFEILGGEITINNPYGTGGNIELINDNAGFYMDGGSISIDSGGNTLLAGVCSYGENTTVEINGGVLNISNSSNGISLAQGGTIDFNGGTTTIKNSTSRAVVIDQAADPENDIAFGEGMGIKESDATVFWVKEGDEYAIEHSVTGIVDEGLTTIAKGYDVNRVHGWGINYADEEEESDVKTPDTGIFSGETEQSTLLAISLGMVAATTSILGLALYAAKRFAARAKFNK